ncbi:hypothetical protein [Lacipirellula sp.]|uniref:hypothetical protein n=1 Tax=Lacipirellula sp. TaxID=2691419 RepID=UPI003D11A4C2
MERDPLPDDNQRRALAELLHAAFIELRSISDRAAQVEALADAFHNLPVEVYGWGCWDVALTRSMLQEYRSRYPDGGPDYVDMFDKIFPNAASKCFLRPAGGEQG